MFDVVNRDACILPKKVGIGLESQTRYYFSDRKCRCQKFVYSGLRGNENHFDDIESCEETCESWEIPGK